MKKLTLIQKFSLLCLITIVLFGFALAWVVTSFIERNMLIRSEETTAEFVHEEIKRELSLADITTPKFASDYDDFSQKVSHLTLGPYVIRVKIWNSDQVIVWSEDRRLVGQRFPDNERLAEALSGKIVSALSVLEEDEHIFEQQFEGLLELYVPIRLETGGEISAVVEIYQNLSSLYVDISREKLIVWISVILGFAALYLVLFGIVRRASRRLETQTEALQKSHKEMEKRVKERTADLATTNEKLKREIVDHKQAEEALRKSEEKYKELAECISDVFFAMDKDLKYTYWNKASEKLTGIAAKEAIGKSLHELFSDIKGTNAEKAYLKVLKSKKVQSFENAYRIGNRDYIFEITAYPTSDGCSVFTKDITERKQAEEALRESELKFRTSVETLLDGFGIFSAVSGNDGSIVDFRYEYTNKAGCQLIQRSSKELLGHTILEIFPRHKEVGLVDEYVRVVETGRPLIKDSIFFEDVYGSGVILGRVFELRAVKLGDGFVVTWRDITNRKKIEEEHQKERNMLRTLIDNVPDLIYIKDTESRFVNGNIAVANLMGAATPEDLNGKTDFDYYSKELAAQYYADEQEVIRTGKSQFNREEPLIDSAGRKGWLSTTQVPLKDTNGEIMGIVGIGRDITERKKAEKALRKSEENFRNIFKYVPESLLAVDKKIKILDSNNAFAKLLQKYASALNMSEDELQERILSELRKNYGQKEHGIIKINTIAKKRSP